MFGKDKKENSNEKILYETQPNIIVYSKSILLSMILLGFLFFLYSAGIQYIGNMNVYLIESTKWPITRYFAIAVFILIMIVILYIILKLLIWTSIKYTITENRVIVEKGILLQKKNSMPFNTIQDISRSQSLLGRLFSVGSLTLYSAYDGKELELKDVSSPKKIEDIIFEGMRGTHLRPRNLYNDDYGGGPSYNPVRPHSDEPVHYRRMEDLDDLELVDAKERKRNQRELKRKARNARNIQNYNSNYSDYGSNYSSDYYGSSYDDYYDDYGGYDDYSRDMNYNPNYRDDRVPRDSYRDNYGSNRVPRDNYRNNQYDSGMRRPDSHHHQYSGAIKESYSRNPDKYFADNYEEFHQSNLDAQREYDEYMQGRTAYPDEFSQDSQEVPKVEKKSGGLSRFNPFSSNKKEDDKNISDEEFDSTINQAMQDMEDNIRFKPSNDNQFRDNPQYNSNQRNQDYYNSNQYNSNQYNKNQSYGQSYPKQSRGYDRNYDNRNYKDQNYDDRYYDDYSNQYRDSRPLRNNDSSYYDNRYDDYKGRNDYRQNENYRENETYRTSRRNPNYNSNSQNRSRSGAYPNDDGEIDYKYRSPRDSRKSRKRNPNPSDEYNYEEHNSNYEKDDGNTQDEVFEKHARKFRR